MDNNKRSASDIAKFKGHHAAFKLLGARKAKVCGLYVVCVGGVWEVSGRCVGCVGCFGEGAAQGEGTEGRGRPSCVGCVGYVGGLGCAGEGAAQGEELSRYRVARHA